MTAWRTSWAIWRWPVVLAILTVFGLLSALIGRGGLWWCASWIVLATPLIVIAWSVTTAAMQLITDKERPSCAYSRSSTLTNG